ncbi:MAG: NmrA/HSCARG family protein [Longimicrobiales bacterium]
MPDSELVLVTGATGKQGGAVAHALLARGHRVRALARNPDSAAARALADRGAELVTGDFADAASLVAAMRGTDAVFAMSTPFEAGMDAETRQGNALVDAAGQAGVGHFVYTSVAGADRSTKIPHFDTKYAVEQHLAGTKLPWTVIAPVYFMENLFFPQTLDGLRSGVYATPLPADRSLQQIAVADIGAFGARVVEQRDAFLGQRIDIAGDELTATEQAAILGDVLGREIRTVQTPMDQIRAFSEDMAIMYQWFIDHGYTADIDGLRSRHPVGWHRFADWARDNVPAAI